nr:MAG TPA: signaling protein [Caudoviricetes sp.]
MKGSLLQGEILLLVPPFLGGYSIHSKFFSSKSLEN